jgi:hypothetical protein
VISGVIVGGKVDVNDTGTFIEELSNGISLEENKSNIAVVGDSFSISSSNSSNRAFFRDISGENDDIISSPTKAK